MTKKEYTAKAAPKKRRQLHRAEKLAVKKFNAALQKAIEKVNWEKVELPRQSC